MTEAKITTTKRALQDPSVFEEECRKTARTLSRNNHKVVFGGDVAMTDGDTTYLPSIDRSAQLDQEMVDVVRGYVDHESGHNKFTDNEAYSKAARELGPWGAQVLNCLEDIWRRLSVAGACSTI